ncbi:MAG: tRNA pseudouridine(13) synthase TruD [Planctomycetes bacterium]|nr:tRNA pseudouridine(13) synthase TruD [Planctomycetota bacterium]
MKYASSDISACPGKIKTEPQDFIVEEIPLYEFAGSGTHTLVQIEKTGISTFEAVRRICREIGFNERNVGSAGLKDTQGITRQWLSFEHIEPAKFEALDIPKLKIIQTTRHENKLKRGHLAGNRFEIVLREVDEANVANAENTLEILAKRGVPNWYDSQRFGRRGDTGKLGFALLKNDYEGFFKLFLGTPETEQDTQVRDARIAYEEGKLEEALKLFPNWLNNERIALKAIIANGQTIKAMQKIPQKLKLLFLSAAQSQMFNDVLAQRFDSFDRVQNGDLAVLESGATFAVADADTEQERAISGEITATGPIFGHKMQQPDGEVLKLEQAVLADYGLDEQAFKLGKGLSQKGDRRALRFALSEASCNFDAGDLRLAFTLPKGCYATVILKEITKE